MTSFPFKIIQAPMGVAVSSWPLARAVSLRGQLGVVAGTALEIVLTRRLQTGDPGGHIRRALAHFPSQPIANSILDRYLRADRAPNEPFLDPPPFELDSPRELLELAVAATFVEVFLAKENHRRPIGINFLEKIQLPLLPSIYGAMLADVDYLLISAGQPSHISAVIEALATNCDASYPISIINQAAPHLRETTFVRFSPREFFPTASPLRRPGLFATVTSPAQAAAIATSTPMDAFILQLTNAGGHTSPRTPELNDLSPMQKLHIPFFLAGRQGHPGKLRQAIANGAAGIQVGTAFAFCDESGLAPSLKQAVINLAKAHRTQIRTDPNASPTGFPLKILHLENSLSNPIHYQRRPRICDLAHLRRPVRLSGDGRITYRCPAEPVEDYLRKGGLESETHNKQCLCNALFTNIDLATPRPANHPPELPLLTASEDAHALTQFLPPDQSTYSAADVLALLLD